MKIGLGLAGFLGQLSVLLLDGRLQPLARGRGPDPEFLIQFVLSGGEIADRALQAAQQCECLVNPQMATHSLS
jgi:hypothetical protein